MKPRKLRVFALAFWLLIAAIFLMRLGAQQTSSDAASLAGAAAIAQATAVEVSTVETRDLETTISSVGSLRAKESVTLAPEIGGRVSAIHFEEGQRVEAGMVLFELDKSILNASLQSAHAAHALAQSTFIRTEALSKRGVNATQALEEALANLRNTEAALALAEAQLAQTYIKAPFSGIVGLRAVSIGAYVSAGSTSLARLDQIDPLVVEFTLPEVALGSITPAQQVSVTTDALPGQTFLGQVYAVEPSIEETGRAIRMRAMIPNADLKLRPGLFARVNVTTGTKTDAILVPESAIVPSGDLQTVFRINDGGTVEVVSVMLGQRLDGKVEILTGLDSNASVVVAGQQKLQNGSRVSVRLPAAEGAA